MFGVGSLGVIQSSGAAGPVYDPAAVSFFARLGTQPTVARKALYSTFFTSLRTAGTLGDYDAIWLMAAADAATANTNLISSSFTLTPTNAPTFTADRGYTGNGTSSYLTTGIKPGVGGLQYQQNNANFSLYDRTLRAGADSLFVMGAYDGVSASFLQTTDSSGNFSTNVNDGAGAAGAAANAVNTGFYAAERNNAANISSYKNGVASGPFTDASIAPLGTQDFWILAVNLNGAPTGFVTDQVAAASVGSALGAANAAYYAAIQAYMTGVGANV